MHLLKGVGLISIKQLSPSNEIRSLRETNNLNLSLLLPKYDYRILSSKNIYFLKKSSELRLGMPLSRVCLACMRARVQSLTLHKPSKVIQNGNPSIEKAETCHWNHQKSRRNFPNSNIHIFSDF